MDNQQNDVDLLIIGAGPIGLACGIEAKKAGISYVIVDKGCLVNSLYNYPKNMTFFSTSDRLEIGGVPFISHNPKPVRAEALEYYRRVASSWELNTRLYEKVEKVNKIEEGFDVLPFLHELEESPNLVACFIDLGIPPGDRKQGLGVNASYRVRQHQATPDFLPSSSARISVMSSLTNRS